MRWCDIDFIHKKFHVQKASVVGVIKGTKTTSGNRKVDLDEQAISALSATREFTNLRSEYIFEDPGTSKPWANSASIREKAWVPSLKLAKVRYRNPYQTRHTFATRNISIGVNLFWLAGQMGHKGPAMLFRHYGMYVKEYDGQTTCKEIKI